MTCAVDRRGDRRYCAKLLRYAGGEIFERHELVAGIVGVRDEVGVHLRGVGRAGRRIGRGVPRRGAVIVDGQHDDGRAGSIRRDGVELRQPVGLGLCDGLALVLDLREVEGHVRRDVDGTLIVGLM